MRAQPALATEEQGIMTTDGPFEPKIIRVVEYDNQDIVVSRYPFIYEDLDRPELSELRERYQLHRIVGAGSEFERQVALRCWRATRFPHGKHAAPEARILGPIAWNGLLFLKAAEYGSSFTCPAAAMTYIQLCLAMGWPARLIEICQAHKEWIPPSESNVAHTVSEVWSNEYRKWVLMDPDCNLHYARNRIPLSALEVHEAWMQERTDDVELVQGDPPFHSDGSMLAQGFDEPAEFKKFFAHRVMDYYHEIRVTLRNNHLSQPVYQGDQAKGWFPQLVWVDPGDRPMVMRTGKLRPYVEYSALRHDFEWTLNQAHIQVESGNLESMFTIVSRLRVNLTTVTPWFSHFEARIDDGAWRRVPASFVINMHPGINRIQARPVNHLDVTGIISTMAVELTDQTPTDASKISDKQCLV